MYNTCTVRQHDEGAESAKGTTHVLFRHIDVSVQSTKCTTHVLFRQQTVSVQSTRCTTQFTRRVWRFLPKLITLVEYTGKYSGIQWSSLHLKKNKIKLSLRI